MIGSALNSWRIPKKIIELSYNLIWSYENFLRQCNFTYLFFPGLYLLAKQHNKCLDAMKPYRAKGLKL